MSDELIRALQEENRRLRGQVDKLSRLQAERAPEGDAAHLRMITDHMADIIVQVDADDRVLYASPSVERMFGYAPSEVVGHPVTEFLHPADTARVVAAGDAAVARRGAVIRIQCRCRRAAGDYFWLEAEWRLLYDDTDAYAGSILSGRDVTERLRAEQLLRESEAQYRTLVESANSIILRLDTQGHVLFVNEFAQEFFGFSEQELIGSSVVGTIVPETESTGRDLRALLADICHNPVPYTNNDNENITRAGRRVWVRWTNRALLDSEGRLASVLCVGNDITDRKLAEDELRASEERTRTFIDASEDLIFLKDRELRYLLVNRANAQFFGLDESEIIGKRDGDLMPPAAAAACEASDRAALHAAGAVVAEEVVGDRTYETRKFPVRLAGGEAGVGGYIKDITELKHAEDAARLATVGQLAAGVAHEFNNLLASMMLKAERALSRGASDEHGALAALVLRLGGRGAGICRSLTAFAQPSELRPSLIPIEQPLEAALAVASQQLTGTQVGVVRDYATADRRIEADPAQLEQVFLNLLINACHAMPQGGLLTLGTRYRGTAEGPGQIVLTVADTGVGIPHDQLPHIFEPFFTTKGRLGASDVPGAGLGLSVSHGIVTAHGGTITACSQPGVGTTFELCFPARELAPREAAAAGPGDDRLAPGHGRRLTVVVAEDETDLRELIADELADLGHHVIATAAASEAIHAVDSADVDIVIADLMMPGGGGREILAAAQELEHAPPVIVITGRAEAQLQASLATLGAAEVCQKPFTREALLAAIERATAGQATPPSRPDP